MKDLQRKHRAALRRQVLNGCPQESGTLVGKRLSFRCLPLYDAQVLQIPHGIGLCDLFMPAYIDGEVAGGGEEISAGNGDLIAVLQRAKKGFLDNLFGVLAGAY